MKLGGIEAGGTKFILGVGDENGQILIRESIPCGDPKTTVNRIIKFFKQHEVQAIGCASFGPIELNKNSPKYGYITSTPKPHWADTPILPWLQEALAVPFGFDTDVNAAVLGESLWGNGRGIDNLIYITVGTGIGGGVISSGQLIHGLLHPELGHMLLQVHPTDTFKGVCPFHTNCFEGLASGVSIEKRWGKKASELPLNHPAWDLEADYIAKALMNLILVLSPQRILLGGGVMHQSHLFPLIREKVKTYLNGYLLKDEILIDTASYIQAPYLKDDAGICGAFALAKQALDQSK